MGSSGDRKYIQSPYEAEEALSDRNTKLKVVCVVTRDNELSHQCQTLRIR